MGISLMRRGVLLPAMLVWTLRSHKMPSLLFRSYRVCPGPVECRSVSAGLLVFQGAGYLTALVCLCSFLLDKQACYIECKCGLFETGMSLVCWIRCQKLPSLSWTSSHFVPIFQWCQSFFNDRLLYSTWNDSAEIEKQKSKVPFSMTLTARYTYWQPFRVPFPAPFSTHLHTKMHSIYFPYCRHWITPWTFFFCDVLLSP